MNFNGLIRPMREEDASKLAVIHTLAWQVSYRGIVHQGILDAIDVEKRADNWRRGIQLNDPPLIRLVAEKDERLLGFACGLENRILDFAPLCDCELWAIYVNPSDYRTGTGRALLDRFRHEMTVLGKKRLCIWTLKDNSLARHFYENQGGVLSPKTKEIKIGTQSLIEVAYEFDLSHS